MQPQSTPTGRPDGSNGRVTCLACQTAVTPDNARWGSVYLGLFRVKVDKSYYRWSPVEQRIIRISVEGWHLVPKRQSGWCCRKCSASFVTFQKDGRNVTEPILRMTGESPAILTPMRQDRETGKYVACLPSDHIDTLDRPAVHRWRVVRKDGDG